MAFPPSIELAALDGNNGLIINGAASGDFTGRSVSNAGDVNDDGFDDVIVGAPFADANSGTSYVVFGQPEPFVSPIDLAGFSLANPAGFAINGLSGSGQNGISVSSGDFNDDDISDLLIGVPAADGNAGAAYVVFGSKGLGSGGPIELDGITALTAPQGLVLTGAADSKAGTSVSNAGDIDGDGDDDLIVGTTSGTSYVVFGKEDLDAWGNIPLPALDGTNGGFAINGGEGAAISVSNAGDLDKDGFDDLIIGTADANGKAGDSYVVFGHAGPFASVDLATLATPDGFKINGATAGGASGTSVSAAGDVNDDEFDDIIIGASGVSGETGTSYVLFGGNTIKSISTIDLLDPLDGTTGFSVPTPIPSNAGVSVSYAGDVNHDGVNDLIIGASNASAAYVVFGGKGLGSSGTFDLASLDGTNGFNLSGPSSNAGSAVSNAGDVNKDGIDDVIVGAISANSGAGGAYVVFGQPDSSPPPPPLPHRPEEPNHAPVAGDDHYTTPWGPQLSVAGPGLLTNDTDQDGDALTVSGIVSTTQHGVLAWSADGGFTYTLNVEFSGTDGFTYTISDGQGGTDAASVTIDITDENNRPPTQFEVVGGFASEQFWGTNRGDQIRGMDGNDTIDGDGGRDILNGNGGNDVVNGEGDEDLARGGQGDDWVLGGAGSDTVHGDQGNDQVWGGRGNDQVFGDAGDDVLHGDRGNDALAGGEGADQFAFGEGSGLDRVTDFDLDGGDQIRLEAGAFASFADIQAHLTDGPDGVVLNLGDGNAVTIAGVTKADLSAGDFLIV